MSKKDTKLDTEDGANLHAYERSRRDAICAVSQQPDASKGATSCNTAPPKYNSPQVVNQGIDSLYLSYSGCLPLARCKQLDNLKALAQSYDPLDKSDAKLELGEMVFKVHKQGRNPYAYLISNALFIIRVASSTANTVPVAYVEISSQLLNVRGVEHAMAISDSIVAELVGEPCFPKVSRADIFVDFVSVTDWADVKNEQWCCRSTKKNDYYDKHQLTGYSFGQGGDVSARLYDKTVEIEHTQKAFFKDIWLANGWDGLSPVWRIEFQLRQKPIKEFGLSEPVELLEELNGVWRYCTEKWLNLRKDNGDKNRSRWPLAEIWAELIELEFGQEKRLPMKRVKSETVPSRNWLVMYTLGGLTSYMAANGHDDLEHAFNRFVDDADEYFNEFKRYGFDKVKDYVDAKVAEKLTRFCKLSTDKE